MDGKLAVVPTPIGRATDLSPRAREALATADLVAAEDTRVTAKLLRELGVHARELVSCHDFNEGERSADFIERIRAGRTVVLVSDAGTPLVSDPGYRVVKAVLAEGLPVEILPGPCAAIVALVGSGLPPDRFLFLGFLPRDAGPRARALEERRRERATIVLYEAPHRIKETLAALREAWGDRRAALARSVTKEWEAWVRGPLSALEAALADEDPVRGELTLVVEGDPEPERPDDEERVQALVRGLVQAGVPVATVRDVVARVYDRPRREVYQPALAARDEGAE
jgi:16S rRNA (cytidine1402-2'-O)-methyltransferase